MYLTQGKISIVYFKWKIFNHYFCNNCGHWFRTGCYTKEEEQDSECKRLYDDICPSCGALSVPWYYCFNYFFYKLFHRSAHKKYLEKQYKKSKGSKYGPKAN